MIWHYGIWGSGELQHLALIYGLSSVHLTFNSHLYFHLEMIALEVFDTIEQLIAVLVIPDH